MSWVLVVCAALGGDAERRVALEQSAVVDAIALELAQARARGDGRARLAELMARYRKEAETLAALEAPVQREDADLATANRTLALRRLADAIATGRPDVEARSIVVGWLGEADPRLKVLDLALAAVATTNDDALRVGLSLDVAEQAGAVGLLCRYDAAMAGVEASRWTAQAAALRARTLPGQSGGMDLVAAAERARHDAADATARASAARIQGDRADAVRLQALALSQEASP